MTEPNNNDVLNSAEKTFCATRTELIAALVTYAASYIYTVSLFNGTETLWLWLPVGALLVGAAELLFRGGRPAGESFIWLGCFAVCVLSTVFSLSHVWARDRFELFVFVHAFLIWWVMSRSGKLLEGESGHMLPVDAFNALIRLPFGNFSLGFRTLAAAGREKRERGGEKKKPFGWVLLAAIVCAALFIKAAVLLSEADSSFGMYIMYMEKLFSRFRMNCSWNAVFYFLFSIPVWCWLYGLIGGAYRLESAAVERQRAGVNAFLEKIRRVPSGLWCAAVGAFSVMYLAFFVMQFGYLFGAFTRTLPEGFIVSEYARQGFFELCRIMALNFALLWLVTRMNDGGRGNGPIRLLCAVLLGESMIFALIALSKLGLYISCFGFTPRRLQSTWLVCVLLAGCILWMYTLFTERRVFRKWMYFSAVSLAALALV